MAVICNTHVDINGVALPAVQHKRDLEVVMSSDLFHSLHLNEIVAKGHKCAALIHRVFVSRNVNSLLRAYLVYVRPLSRDSVQ